MIYNCVKVAKPVHYTRTKLDNVAQAILLFSRVGKMTHEERSRFEHLRPKDVRDLFEPNDENFFFDKKSQCWEDHDYLNFLDGRVEAFSSHYPDYDLCYEFDPNHKGLCRCNLCSMLYLETEEETKEECTDRDSYVNPPSEIHPFPNEVQLLGGGKNRNKTKGKGKEKRRRNGAPRRGNLSPQFQRPQILGVNQRDVALGPTKTTWLKYVDGSDQRAFAGFGYGSWLMKLNDVYDPDPLLGTGGITGFAEMSAFYRRWIVQKVRMTAYVCNRETFPLKLAVILSPDPITTNIVSRATALDAMERWGVLGTYELSPQTGMDRIDFDFSVLPPRVLGDPGIYRNSGLYSGFSNASPAAFLYVNFVLVAPVSIVTIANGVFYSLTVSYKTKFYSSIATLLGVDQARVEYLNALANDAHRRGDSEQKKVHLEEIRRLREPVVPNIRQSLSS